MTVGRPRSTKRLCSPVRDAWQLWRQDDHGTEFLVREFAERAEAERVRDEFVARKHHQHYWVSPAPDADAPPPRPDAR